MDGAHHGIEEVVLPVSAIVSSECDCLHTVNEEVQTVAMMKAVEERYLRSHGGRSLPSLVNHMVFSGSST